MTTSPEEIAAYEDVYKQVKWWIIPPDPPEPDYYLPGTDIPYMTEGQHIQWQQYVYPVLIGGRIAGHEVDLLRREVHYSLLSDIREWFSSIRSLIWANQPEGSTWLGNISHYVWRVSEEVITWLTAIRDAVQAELIGIANYVGNIYTWVVWNMVDDIKNFAINLFKPITNAWSTVTGTLEYWLDYIYNAIIGFAGDPIGWIQDALSDLGGWLGSIANMIWNSLVALGDVMGAWLGAKLTLFAPLVVENLRDALIYIWDTVVGGVGAVEKLIQDALTFWWKALKDAWIFVVEDMVPAVLTAGSGAFGALKDEFTNLIGLAYDELLQKATALVPVTPERSAGIALGMFGTAVGFGALAHGMALAVEAIPNLKYMGTHYLSAFVARMGSFGTISSATMGVIAALAIREPFTYYMNSILRPAIPDEKLLIEFRAKRDLDFNQFKGYMKYHGFTDEWIATIDSWLWKDPRLFEILYCADVTVPPTEWLQRKFERAGYEDIDISTLIKVVERRTTRSPRSYYTTSLRRNFRHGFLTETELVEGIRALEMAEEAIDWIKRAGELDNIYEVNQDWVLTFKTAYRNDILTEDEMIASLTAIGLPRDRVQGISELEWVRKQPRILAAERKEFETEWRKIQTAYSRVYIESFRKGLITEGVLAAYLTAIGINDKVASMSARHEVIKLTPKPKPEAIAIPVIPAPPEPPVYDI